MKNASKQFVTFESYLNAKIQNKSRFIVNDFKRVNDCFHLRIQVFPSKNRIGDIFF